MDFTESPIPACSNVGLACRLGDADTVTRLIAAGAPVDVADNRGWLPIHEAVYSLHKECARIVLEHESGCALVDAAAHDGLTPLLIVCRRDKQRRRATEMARMLLEHGADVNKSSLDEMTPLIQAIRVRNHELINLLLDRGADRRRTWYKLWSALHETAARKDEKTMRRLIEDGVTVFDVDGDSQTALYVACQEGFLPTVKLLLDAAGDRAAELANIRAENGACCCYAAASEGYDRCLEALLERGANCNFTMDPVWAGPDAAGGVHPLAAAAAKNYSRCVRLLIPRLDMAVLERSEVDPLAVAAAHGATETVRILIADSDLPIDRLTEAPQNHLFIAFLRPVFQRRYYTALREAVRKGHGEIVHLLINAGAEMTFPADVYSPFLFSFRNRISISILHDFLAHNVALNQVCQGSLTAVPDAVLAALGSENRQQLLTMLRCGLRPCLEHWCGCPNPSGYSLIEEVRHLPYIGNLKELILLLTVFSTRIPNCCNAIASILGIRSGENKVFRLQHLSRCALRAGIHPSRLLDDRWLTEGDRALPANLIAYLRCETLPGSVDELIMR